MIIIGITGTIGAGKGTIVEYLIKEKKFAHYSVRDYLIEIIKKENLSQNRDSMVLVANALRKKHSPSYITDELYNKALISNNNSVIESIRTPGEIYSLQRKGNFFLFAVDALQEIRYERISLRNSVTDNISLEEFKMNEKREMNSQDPNHQNLQKCIELSDFVFDNNGTIIELQNQVENVINQILITDGTRK